MPSMISLLVIWLGDPLPGGVNSTFTTSPTSLAKTVFWLLVLASVRSTTKSSKRIIASLNLPSKKLAAASTSVSLSLNSPVHCNVLIRYLPWLPASCACCADPPTRVRFTMLYISLSSFI